MTRRVPLLIEPGEAPLRSGSVVTVTGNEGAVSQAALRVDDDGMWSRMSIQQITMPATTTDKISLYDDRLGATNGYCLGVESATLYYRALSHHRWYINSLADGGTSDVMELSADGLDVAGDITVQQAGATDALLDLKNTNGEWKIKCDDATGDLRLEDVDGGVDSPLVIEQGSIANQLVLDGTGTGYVGIGTAAPSQQLHVYRATGPCRGLFETGDASSAANRMVNSVRDWLFGLDAGGHFAIYDVTGGTRPVYIERGALTDALRYENGAHAWGMFTGSPTAELTVNGDIRQTVHTDNVSNPPTDAQLDGMFGTPATVGAGFTAYIDDNGAGANFYQVVSDGTNWWIFTGTKAT